MDKKLLEEYRYIEEYIKTLENDLQKINDTIGDIQSGTNSEIRCTTVDSKVEKLVVKKVEMEEVYLEALGKSIALKMEIIKAIELINNSLYKNILYMRYIEGFEWNKICNKLGYTRRHMRRLHNEALESI